MDTALLLLSSDPIAIRILSRLLRTSGYEVRTCADADSVRACKGLDASIALLDRRLAWDAQPDVAAALGSTPVVLLCHGPPAAGDTALDDVEVVGTVDALGMTFEELIRQLLEQLTRAGFRQPARVPAAGISVPAVPARAAAGARAVEAIPGRVAVGRVVEQSAALKWHELYRDQGLLAEELRSRAVGDVASADAAGSPPRFERRLPKQAAVAKIEEYSQARPLKTSVSLALRISRDSSATVEDMARVVKQDQALAARVLQLANSSLHRRGSAVRTVEQAIVRMGVSLLRETISSTNVLDQFEDPSGVINIPLLWEHGYAVGMLAADLARACRGTSPEDAFMIGLMHDMGRAVMASTLGQDYIDALLDARRHDLQQAMVEKQYFEINHADVADTLFSNWDFDEAIIAPVANHHLSDRNLKHMSPVHVRQTKLLQAADTLAHASLLGDSGSDWIDANGMDLGGSPIAPGLVRGCIERASKTLEEIRLLNESVHDGHGKGYAAYIGEQMPAGVTLGWVQDAVEIDFLSLLAWSIGGRGVPPERADVILATVRKAADLAPLERCIEHHDGPDRPVALVLSVVGDALSQAVRARYTDRPLHVVPQVFRTAWVLAGIGAVVPAS